MFQAVSQDLRVDQFQISKLITDFEDFILRELNFSIFIFQFEDHLLSIILIFHYLLVFKIIILFEV